MEVGHREAALVRAAREGWGGRTGALGAGDSTGAGGATLGDGTRNTFLGSTLAKARTKAIATSETREGKATILGERASSEVSPAEALDLVGITLVRRSARAGVIFLGAPVRSGGLARGQKREKHKSRSDLHTGRISATSDGKVGRERKIE